MATEDPAAGFKLLDGYRTKLTGLDPDEAEAMLMIGLPQEAQAMGLGSAATRARNKLLAALPTAGSDEANRIAGRFHLDTADWYRAARPTPFLARVARAVLDRQRLAMTYESWNATRQWEVDPYGLVLKAGNWYLVARGSDRISTFNVADINQLELLPEHFDPTADFDLASWWAQSTRDFETRLRPGTARLRASAVGIQRLRLLGTFAGEAIAKAGPPDEEGWREIELPLETIDSSAPMLLGIGPEIDIIEPRDLHQAVSRLAKQVVERLKG